ncbi:MAG TPA: co-chaperone DjlA [Candidatus Acidoferrum sp.]|nr:co-chaperone DjlA [Candidatus Acidoferrum sp.]
MSWWGKLIGGTFGFMLGGPLGAILGAAFGHNFDTDNEPAPTPRQQTAQTDNVDAVQSAFFTATFAMMGHMAKADGLVTRAEIAVAEAVMRQMRLSPQQQQLAMALFAQGKQPDFPVDDVLLQLRRECRNSGHLLQMFLEIQIATALADGNLDAAERRVLERCAGSLGFSEFEYRLILQRLQASQHLHDGGPSQASKLRDAYHLLGVESNTDMETIKKAYRRLMNQHHPDKLVAKGLPQEMMDLASKKTMEIKEAYELIKQSREE